MTEQQCTRCRTANPPEAAFCNGCGTTLARDRPTERPDAAPSGWALATAGMERAPEPVVGFGALRRDELAGWWARLGGWILDGIIALLVIGSATILVGVVGYLLDPDGIERAFDWFIEDQYLDGADIGNSWIWLVLVGGVLVIGYVLWEVLWIRSARMAKPGQSVAGFRVVRVEGLERLSTGRAVGRMFSKALYNVPNLGFLVTVASAFTIGLTERRQGLHDMIAGTACVRKDALARRGIGPDAGNEALVSQAAWRLRETRPAGAPGHGVPHAPPVPTAGAAAPQPPAVPPAPPAAPSPGTPPPAPPGPPRGSSGPFV